MKKINLTNRQRYFLSGYLLGAAESLYEQVLALEIQKATSFTSDEIEEAGIKEVKGKKGAPAAGIKWDKELNKEIELSEKQRLGILAVFGRLERKALEDWTIAGIVTQVCLNSDELITLLKATPSKKIEEKQDGN